jgi:Uncharacterized protein conserved in bacteria (DUF2252)
VSIDPPSGARPDPLQLLAQQEATRLPWLVPLRRERMARSPLCFLRGAAVVMAADLSREPHCGQLVQLCGDAHLLNFGFYASPERQLLFDINDFDETHPGPFEWDLLRLATSLVLAARQLPLAEAEQRRLCRRCLRAYRKAMRRLAAMPLLAMWVWRLDLDRWIETSRSERFRSHLRAVVERARRRDSRQAAGKLCEADPTTGLRFRHNPPLLWRYSELEDRWHGGVPLPLWQTSTPLLYRDSLRPEMGRLLSRFRRVDVALKVVGVGSVGTRCSLSLLLTDAGEDVLLLQAKQAQASVLTPYLPAAEPCAHEGERVVRGQRLLQTASDPFLGWATNPDGDHLYIRHFRDWKGAVELEALDGDGLGDYGRLCAWALAKAHCRSGDGAAIAALLQGDEGLLEALEQRALRHADQTERDHAALVADCAAVPGASALAAPAP